jgi:hypothetical protein
MNKLNKIFEKIEKKWFKKWKKKFPEDFEEMERKNLEVPEKFGKDLEKLTERFAENFVNEFHLVPGGINFEYSLDLYHDKSIQSKLSLPEDDNLKNNEYLKNHKGSE